MANCNKLFLDFDENLKITKTKKDRLKDSKENLRERIREYFKENHPEYVPSFYIQGSYKMGTTIVTKDDECDLDDGIYFKQEIGVTGTTLQGWIKDAVTGATDTPSQHREKCIRVTYKADYHIDFPVYYFPEDSDSPLLAVKNEELQESDPKEVVLWYKAAKDKDGQLNRIVKYLKGWGDHKRNKMPSGLAMTILAEKNIQYHEYDDVAFKETIIKIKESLDDSFECIVPAVPNDDLFESFEDVRKNNFLNNLNDLIDDATEAIDSEPNQLKSSKLWRKHFGDKFPLGLDEDVDAKQAALNISKAAILGGTAKTNKEGKIQETEGVDNKTHSNYGGKN